MRYDQENDKIVSAVGSDIQIFPMGVTFSQCSKIEVDIGGDEVAVPLDQLRELIDGLNQAAVRACV